MSRYASQQGGTATSHRCHTATGYRSLMYIIVGLSVTTLGVTSVYSDRPLIGRCGQVDLN
jgi:hypothetical protein